MRPSREVESGAPLHKVRKGRGPERSREKEEQQETGFGCRQNTYLCASLWTKPRGGRQANPKSHEECAELGPCRLDPTLIPSEGTALERAGWGWQQKRK